MRNRSRLRRAVAALAIALAVAAVIWWQRAELVQRVLERVLAGGPVALARMSEPRFGAEGVGLATLELVVATPVGRLVIEAEQARADYELGAAEMTEVTIERARLRFHYRGGETEAVEQQVRQGPVPFPLRRLRVVSLELDADTPWGHCHLVGDGELTRRGDGTVELAIRDSSQSIHAEFPPDFAAAKLTIERSPKLAVAEVQIMGLNRPDRRAELHAAARPLLEWLGANPLVPDRLRATLSQRGSSRFAPGLAELQLTAAADSPDGFRSLRATAALRQGGRSLAKADIAMSAAGATDVHGQLELDAAELVDLLRPLRPEAFKAWRVTGGHVKGDAELRHRPSTAVAASAQAIASELAMEAGSVQVDGARLELRITDWFAPSAAATLTAPRLQLGESIAADGLAVEASLNGRVVRVEKASLGVFGGRVDLEPASADLGQSPVALMVRVRELDLSRLLATLSQPGLSGSGRVGGTLPVRLSADSIELEEGRLMGDGPGVFRYRGPADDGSLAFRALRNFVYRQFQARADYRPNGDYRIGIRLEGHNPQVLAGHPIAFNLNLSGQLPELLQKGILAGDFERPVLDLYESANAAPKSRTEREQRKPPPADRRDR